MGSGASVGDGSFARAVKRGSRTMTAGFFWNRKKDSSVEKIVSDDRKALTGCRAGSQGKRTRHRG